MKVLRLLVPVITLSVGLGCGGDKDLNKDLKPIDPNAPRPSAAGAGTTPGSGSGASAPGVVK